MFYPASTYTALGSGLILIIASSYSMLKVWQGSKSPFAYTLITFIILEAAQDFASFFIWTFAKPIYFGGQTLHSVNMYAYQTSKYCFLLVSLQSWFFGMKYWESATNCSLTPSLIGDVTIRIIKWTGAIIYTSVMVAMWIWSILTFPGYVNNDSLEQYFKWYAGTW